MKKKRNLYIGIRILCCLILLGCLGTGSMILNVWAETSLPHMKDGADLLDAEQEAQLEEKLDEVSEKQQCDVVIVTIDSLEGKTAKTYADDYFDENGYGIGSDYSGILFLISMDERKWAISTCGYGIIAFTDDGQEYIMGKCLSYLSDGEFYEAFTRFTDLCDRFLEEAREGTPYDKGHMPFAFPPLITIPFAVLIGAVIALLITWSMKMQLKPIVRQNGAKAYEKSGSLKLTDSREIFLYSHVSRQKIEKHESSGGSSIHTSSSGRSHGGSSGSF